MLKLSKRSLEIIVQAEQIGEEPNKPLPCQILELMTGCLEVVFTPKTEGKHTIKVFLKEDGRRNVAQKVCTVAAPEIGDGEGELELELLGDGKGEAVLGERAWFIVLFRNSLSKKVMSLDSEFLKGVEVVVANVGNKRALRMEQEKLEDGSTKFIYTPDSEEIFLYILKEGEVCSFCIIFAVPSKTKPSPSFRLCMKMKSRSTRIFILISRPLRQPLSAKKSLLAFVL